MKKIVILILISFVFIVGCGNKSSDPNKSVSSPHKPMVEATDTLNSAMSDSVSRLGNLSGFTQYYLVADAYSEATKIFINEKTGKIAFAYAYLKNNSPYIQRAQMFLLGGKGDISSLEIYLVNESGDETLVDKSDYASFTFYDTVIISAEKKISKADNGSGNWEVENDLPDLPMLIEFDNNGGVLNVALLTESLPPDPDSDKYELANEANTFDSAVITYYQN